MPEALRGLPRRSRAYFSYGANMVAGAMARRCPTARLMGKARLDDHALRIGRCGYATVVARRGTAVHGLLWRLGRRDERALDAYEEVAAGLYRKATCVVVLEDGRRLSALIYRAARSAPGRARPGYIGPIIAAAIAHGFPPAAIAALSRWSRR